MRENSNSSPYQTTTKQRFRNHLVEIPQEKWVTAGLGAIVEMDSGSGKRNRGNSLVPANEGPSITANNENGTRQNPQSHPNISDNTGGDSMTTEREDESKPQNMDLGDSEQSYGIQTQQPQTHSPRNRRDIFVGSTYSNEKASRPNAAIEPPVTKSTLSELDVNKIVQNPRLRHDINFDPDLHFRPNLDGEKGRKKTQKSNLFWDTMKSELVEYLTNRENF